MSKGRVIFIAALIIKSRWFQRTMTKFPNSTVEIALLPHFPSHTFHRNIRGWLLQPSHTSHRQTNRNTHTHLFTHSHTRTQETWPGLMWQRLFTGSHCQDTCILRTLWTMPVTFHSRTQTHWLWPTQNQVRKYMYCNILYCTVPVKPIVFCDRDVDCCYLGYASVATGNSESFLNSYCVLFEEALDLAPCCFGEKVQLKWQRHLSSLPLCHSPHSLCLTLSALLPQNKTNLEMSQSKTCLKISQKQTS